MGVTSSQFPGLLGVACPPPFPCHFWVPSPAYGSEVGSQLLRPPSTSDLAFLFLFRSQEWALHHPTDGGQVSAHLMPLPRGGWMPCGCLTPRAAPTPELFSFRGLGPPPPLPFGAWRHKHIAVQSSLPNAGPQGR